MLAAFALIFRIDVLKQSASVVKTARGWSPAKDADPDRWDRPFWEQHFERNGNHLVLKTYWDGGRPGTGLADILTYANYYVQSAANPTHAIIVVPTMMSLLGARIDDVRGRLPQGVRLVRWNRAKSSELTEAIQALLDF